MKNGPFYREKKRRIISIEDTAPKIMHFQPIYGT